ncbi:hypothetical protein H4Q26_011387 [Puccinia striiformis f. sp. tritici PST-130]|nr:hypothetical protein Pst134EB_020039 [Puccinia striiformis f. sp. tritici]KAI9615448.1 hypothetical protein H4Q26_011387 [Puccinia striiformis f. sp. tritici PST-130]
MEKTPDQSHLNKSLRLMLKLKRASQSGKSQASRRREAKEDHYLDSESKIITLRQLVLKQDRPQTIVDHPRLLTLQRRQNLSPSEKTGTPPSGVRGQLRRSHAMSDIPSATDKENQPDGADEDDKDEDVERLRQKIDTLHSTFRLT